MTLYRQLRPAPDSASRGSPGTGRELPFTLWTVPRQELGAEGSPDFAGDIRVGTYGFHACRGGTLGAGLLVPPKEPEAKALALGLPTPCVADHPEIAFAQRLDRVHRFRGE